MKVKKVKCLLIASALMLMMFVSSAQAQDWKDLYKNDNATKVGGVYAALCNVCNTNGRYNDDNNGVWRCDNDSPTPSPAYKDCKQAIVDAIKGKYSGEDVTSR